MAGPRPAGLDMTVLARHRRPRHGPTVLIDRIAAHLDEHDGYLAFSGGKDSTTVLHLARQADPDIPVCFFDSGLEFPETLTYIQDLAAAWRLNLHILPARPDALTYLRATGAWDHDAPTRPELLRGRTFHDVLIGGPAREAHELHGPGELWGIRAAESAGRRIMLLRSLHAELTQRCTDCCPPAPEGRTHTAAQRARHGGATRRRDGTVAYSPIWDFTDQDIYGYLARHRIPVNPIYRRLTDLQAPPYLQRVGLLIDANNAGQGRFGWLRRGWPQLFDRLADALPRLRELA